MNVLLWAMLVVVTGMWKRRTGREMCAKQKEMVMQVTVWMTTGPKVVLPGRST